MSDMDKLDRDAFVGTRHTLHAMIDCLPETWSEAKRARWLRAVEATLDYGVQVEGAASTEGGNT